MVLSRPIGLALAAVVVAAQPLQVTLQLPFADNMPARIDEWIQNEQLIRVLVHNTDRRSGYENLMILSVRVEREGKVIVRSKDGHPAQPRWALGPGQTQAFSWREVVALEALEYDQILAQQTIATGELPEGRYQLCLTVLQLPLLQPMSLPACGSFRVVSCCPQPITLLNPPNGATVSAPPLLQWTPCAPPTVAPLFYRVTVAPRWFGQSPADAIKNPPRVQQVVPVPQYQVTPTEWSQLLSDAAVTGDYVSHVWQVQPLRQVPGGFLPCGKPSPIGEFRVRSKLPPPADSWSVARGRLQLDTMIVLPDTIRFLCDLPVPPPDTVLMELELEYPTTLPTPGGSAILQDRSGSIIFGQLRPDSILIPVPILGARGTSYYYAPDPKGGQQLSGYVYNGYYLFGVQPGDTLGLSYYGRYTGGYYLFGMHPGDTLGQVKRTRYTGGYFLYRISPGDTLGLSYYAGGYYLYGMHPGDTLGGGEPQAKYTGYVLNQAIASGAGRASGRTLGAVTRQAGPSRTQIVRGKIKLNEPVDIVGLRSRGFPQDTMEGQVVQMRNWAYEVRKDASVYPNRRVSPTGQDTTGFGGGVVVCWPQGRPGDRPVAVYRWLMIRGSKPLPPEAQKYELELEIVKMIIDRPDEVE
ncbi:hypothetical protein HRbin21_01095 [bacterium HR21]|nr:hypothetical protein HRbin21_01095 [bacterium HR21]